MSTIVDLEWDGMAVVGRIARSHGIRGAVVIDPETDFPESRFACGREVFVQVGGAITALRVRDARMQRGRVVVGFDQVGSIEAAERIVGRELRIPISWLERLPAATYYRHELVGCEVETVRGDRLGVVRAVEGDANGSRLVVETLRGDVLVPLAAAICSTIDPSARRIVIDPPDGLVELNWSRSRAAPER